MYEYGDRDPAHTSMVTEFLHIRVWWPSSCIYEYGDRGSAHTSMVTEVLHIRVWWPMSCTYEYGDRGPAYTSMVTEVLHIRVWWPRSCTYEYGDRGPRTAGFLGRSYVKRMHRRACGVGQDSQGRQGVQGYLGVYRLWSIDRPTLQQRERTYHLKRDWQKKCGWSVGFVNDGGCTRWRRGDILFDSKNGFIKLKCNRWR